MRAHEIDILKGISIIGVVIIHIPPTGYFDNNTYAFIHSLKEFFGWSVLSFFFAAGFLSKIASSKKGFIHYSSARCKRLLIPYFFYNILYKTALTALSIFGLIQAATFPIPSSVVEALNFLFAPAPPQLYFLIYLFLIQIASYFFIQRNGIYLGVLLSLATVWWIATSSAMFHEFSPHGPGIGNIPLYILMYFLGAIYAGFDFKSTPKTTRYASAVLLCAISVLVYLVSKPFGHTIAVLAVLSLIISINQDFKLLGLLKFLGLRSGGIYVLHAPIIISVAAKISQKGIGSGLLSLSVLLLLTIGSCLLLDSLMKRFSLFKPIRV